MVMSLVLVSQILQPSLQVVYTFSGVGDRGLRPKGMVGTIRGQLCMGHRARQQWGQW